MARTHFDDLGVGRRLVVGDWTVDPEEAVRFAQEWEPQPHHVDERAAAGSPFEGLTVCSLYLFGVCTRLFFAYEPRFAVLAMLGKERVRLPEPARPGDCLRYETECVEHRESRSRPDTGVVVLRDSLTRPGGGVVLSQDVALLLARRAP